MHPEIKEGDVVRDAETGKVGKVYQIYDHPHGGKRYQVIHKDGLTTWYKEERLEITGE